MIQSIKDKLKSSNGESIAEVLIALLIGVLALTLLASMITAGANMVKTSSSAYEKYLENSSKAAANRLSGASTSEGTVYFKEADGSGNVNLTGKETSGSVSVSVDSTADEEDSVIIYIKKK